MITRFGSRFLLATRAINVTGSLPIRLRMTQQCGWRWMRLSNTFPLAP
jgi:hypothetical protein